MIRKLKKLIKPKKRDLYGWFGNYTDWNMVSVNSGGYEAKNILEKTKQSLLKIKNGEAVYERDSVLFDQKIYPFPIISSLLYIALKNNHKLNVIDFGGSLGSTWFQIKDFIPEKVQVNWTVVEQPEYIACGKEFFEDERLKFQYTIHESILLNQPHVILLSSVVQYLEKPHHFLNTLVDYGINYLLFDRTAFIKNQAKDRLTLQIVPPDVYEASYPSWFFYEPDFLKHFDKYILKAEFTSYVEGETVMQIDGEDLGYDKGFFFEKQD